MSKTCLATLLVSFLVLGCPEKDPGLSVADKRRLAVILEGAERLIDEGRQDSARSALEEALRLDPSNPTAHAFLAATYSADEDNVRALEILDEALQDAPDHPDLLSVRGKVHEIREDFEKATEDFQSYLEIFPEDPAIHLSLAKSEMKLRRHEDAGRSAARALELGLDDPAVHLIIGSTAAKAGRRDAAEASLRRCLELEPGLVEARYQLGNLLLKLGRKEESRKELDRVARLSRLEKEFDEIQEFLRSGKPLPPRGGEERVQLGRRTARIVLEGLKFVEAEDSTEQALYEYPTDRDLLFYRALARLGQGRTEEAESGLRDLRERHPDCEPIRVALLRLKEWVGLSGADRPSRVEMVEELLEGYAP